MKVRALIEQLERQYDLDDELAVAYWDRETVAAFASEPDLTELQWSKVVAAYEFEEFGWQKAAAEQFTMLVVEALEGEGVA